MSTPSSQTDSNSSDEWHSGLLFELWLIKQAIYPLLEMAISETRLSADQYGMVLLVDHLQPVTPAEFARHCGMRTNTVSAALQRLENMELLERRANEHDARSVLVSLSDVGQGTVARAIELAQTAVARIAPLVDGLAVAVAVSELNRAFRLVANLPAEPPRRSGARADPAGQVMFELWLIKQAVYPLLEQAPGSQGLSGDDLGLRLLIERLEPVTPSELARCSGLRPNNLSVALGRLERKGQLTRSPNEHDARSVLVSLSEQGRLDGAAAGTYYDQLTDRLGPPEWLADVAARLSELNTAIRFVANLPTPSGSTAPQIRSSAG